VTFGETHRTNVVGDIRQPDRAWVVDEGSQQALAFGEVADLVNGWLIEPHVDELLERAAVRRNDPERTVGRIDQLTGSFDDATQDRAECEVSDDGRVRAQQAAQPGHERHDVLSAINQLRQQLVQLQAWPFEVGAGAVRSGVRSSPSTAQTLRPPFDPVSRPDSPFLTLIFQPGC